MKKPSRVELKRRKRRRNFRIFLFISVLTGMVIFARKSSLFNIKAVNVKGNINTEKDEIFEKSGIELNDNIFTINPREVRKRIASIPYVKESKVKRNFPNKIDINIVERIEVVQIKSMNNYLKVDKEGIVIEETDIIDPTIPIVNGLNIDGIVIGNNIFGFLEKEEVYEELQSIKNKELLGEIKEVSIEEWDIKVKLFRDIDIILEDFTNLDYKVEMVSEVLHYIDENEIICNMILMNKGESPIIVTGTNEG